MIMVSGVHLGTLVSQFWPRQVVELFSLAHCACSTVAIPLKDHWPRPLCMYINVFAGLKQVRIIEVPDKRDPDNRGCTVLLQHVHVHCVYISWIQGANILLTDSGDVKLGKCPYALYHNLYTQTYDMCVCVYILGTSFAVIKVAMLANN